MFDAHIGAHEKVGTINYGVVSASSGTTGIEDTLESSAHADDQFNNGTIYLIADANTAANDKQARRIVDYDASSGQYSVSSGFNSSVTVGSIYGRATPEFTLQLMDRLTNAALRTLGPLQYIDRSLQSSANQRVYTLSTLSLRSRPFLVQLLGRTGSTTDDPDWVTLYGWDMQPSTVGAGHNLVFPRFLPSGRDILVHYEADHQAISVSTAIIDDRFHPELVTLALVEKMYEYRNSRSRGAQEFDVQRWNDAKRQLAEARVRWPVWRMQREAEINVYGGPGFDESNAPPFGSLE